MTFNDRLELYNFSEGSFDKMGIYKVGEALPPKTIFCDIQNYSTEKFYKNFGYEEEVTNRIFCFIDKNINMNSLLKTKDNKSIEIKKINKYKDYLELFVNEK